MRGADISGDHELVVTKIKIKLEERRSNLEPKKFEGQVQNQQVICPDTRKQYVSTMRKKLDEKPPSDDVEKPWKQLTEVHNETAKTVLEHEKNYMYLGYRPAPGQLLKIRRISKTR